MHFWLGWNSFCVAHLLDWEKGEMCVMLNCIFRKYKYIRKTIQVTKFWARHGVSNFWNNFWKPIEYIYIFCVLHIFFPATRQPPTRCTCECSHPSPFSFAHLAPNFSLWFPLAISRGECGSWTALIKGLFDQSPGYFMWNKFSHWRNS